MYDLNDLDEESFWRVKGIREKLEKSNEERYPLTNIKLHEALDSDLFDYADEHGMIRGYVLLVADCAESALERVRKASRLDLLIADLGLPDLKRNQPLRKGVRPPSGSPVPFVHLWVCRR